MLAWRRATPPTSPWTTSRSSTGPSGAEGVFGCGDQWETDPAIAPAIAVVDGVRIHKHRPPLVPPLVHNVHNAKRPPTDAGGRLAWSRPLSLVAGEGFETAASGFLAKR